MKGKQTHTREREKDYSTYMLLIGIIEISQRGPLEDECTAKSVLESAANRAALLAARENRHRHRQAVKRVSQVLDRRGTARLYVPCEHTRTHSIRIACSDEAGAVSCTERMTRYRRHVSLSRLRKSVPK